MQRIAEIHSMATEVLSYDENTCVSAVDIDRVLTAEEIGTYKPDPRNFASLIVAAGELGVRPEGLLHVAQSLYHDHGPAAAAGLATVWIDRRGDLPGSGATPPGDAGVEPGWVFESMAAFTKAVVD